jgi:hypothetical protein
MAEGPKRGISIVARRTGRPERRRSVYEKYLGRVKEGLDQRVGEEVLAFGLFVPRGSMMMLVSPALSMMKKRQTKKAAGGRKLPRSIALAVTPTSFCAFGVKDSGYTGKGNLKDEVGRWPREGTQVEAGGGNLMSRLTLSFPDGTRLDLEVVNIMGMRKINEEFFREISGSPAG